MSNAYHTQSQSSKHPKLTHKAPQEIYESFEEMNNMSQCNYQTLERQEPNISQSQLETQIAELRSEFQAKLKEVDKIYREIVKKDDEISNVASKTSFATEDTILKKSHLKKIQQLQKESDEKLQLKLEKLKEEFNEEIQLIAEEQEDKRKKIQENINDLKHQIDEYNDKDKYMTKEEHERILSDLRKSHQSELEPFEREIIELEKYINDNYPDIINKENTLTQTYLNESNRSLDTDKSKTSAKISLYSYKQSNKD